MTSIKRKPELPTDPRSMNDKRAFWAAFALTAFQRVTGTDDEAALSDLLCDLMHWCDRIDFEFDAALPRPDALRGRDY